MIFSSPVIYGGQCGAATGATDNWKGISLWFCHGSEQRFVDEYN